MKNKTSDSVITAQLEKIGCAQIPPAVRTKIENDVASAVAEAEQKIVRKSVTIDAVVRAFREVPLGQSDQQELPLMPPALPSVVAHS